MRALSQIPVDEEIVVSTARFSLEVSNILFILALNAGIIDYNYEGGPVQGYSIATRATYVRFGSQVQVR